MHAILSFKPGYQPTNAQLAIYGHRLMVALGADPWRFKYAFIRHHDASHAHVHLVWSRIRDDGALISNTALSRDRICHLLGGLQDSLVVGETYRDALGGTSRACLMADHLLASGGSTARLTHTDGRMELIHLQGKSAATRLARVGLLDAECIGGIAKVAGYWDSNRRSSDGRTYDHYLTRAA